MAHGDRAIDTKAVHAGEPRPRIGGAVAMPIFQTSTYDYEGETDYHDIRYARLSNSPNHLALHAKLAALENAEAALVTASGMAAISGVLLSILRSGDHVLAQDCLELLGRWPYGPAYAVAVSGRHRRLRSSRPRDPRHRGDLRRTGEFGLSLREIPARRPSARRGPPGGRADS